MTFDEAFERLIGHEGRFQAYRSDRGNWTGGAIGAGELRGTKWGISAAAYPKLDIESLTLEQAKGIYLVDYWQPLLADYRIPERLHFTLFDIAVNAGLVRARKLLQQALGVTQDGAIGPKTLAALEDAEPGKLLARLHAYRLLYAVQLKAFDDFGKGWVRRTAENLLEDFG